MGKAAWGDRGSITYEGYSSSIKFDSVEIAFVWASLYWLKPLTDEAPVLLVTGGNRRGESRMERESGVWSRVCRSPGGPLSTAPPRRSLAGFVGWLVDCLTSQQHASISQGRICSDKCTCCNTEIEVADPTFYLIQSQYTDTGSTSPSADPGAWQGSYWNANFGLVDPVSVYCDWMRWKVMTQSRKKKTQKNIPTAQAGIELRIFRSWGGHLNH